MAELRRWQAEALPAVLHAASRRRRGIVSAIMGSGKSILMAEICRRALPKTIERRQAIVVVAPRKNLVRQLAGTFERWLSEHGVDVAVGQAHSDLYQPHCHVVVSTAASYEKVQEDLRRQGRMVSLLLVDECHSSEADLLKAAIIATGAVCQVGFTATPMRSVRGERLELWDEVVYRYTMEDGLRDGVLVPMRVVRQEGLENRPLDEACLEMIRSHCSGPGIVSAKSIEDAEAYASWLKDRGVGAEAIHSRLSQATQDELLRRLRARALDCLVHVSLLAEGVDFPWLRWICLRRKVQASVRFLQEIGRPMRAEPGKTECVVIDPHLLLGRFGLRPAEAIGQALELAAVENDMADDQDQRERNPGQPTEEEAIALEGLLAHLDDNDAWLRRQGVITERPMDGSAGWALADITHKQVQAIGRAGRLTRHVPSKHRAAIKALLHVPWALNRGQATMLLGVLYGGAKWARVEGERRQLPDRLVWAMKWDELPGEEPEELMAKTVERGVKRMQRERLKAAEQQTRKVDQERLLVSQNLLH